MHHIVGAIVVMAVVAGCNVAGGSSARDQAASDSTAHLAHEAYTTAINSNNLDSLMAMMTDDVVFLAAHAPPIVGKAAVRSWAEGYLQGFTTRWDKQSQEFVVNGDWAFERYSYRSTDTPARAACPCRTPAGDW